MRKVYRILRRIRTSSRQRREERTLLTMSAIELQDMGYPHRLEPFPCRDVPEIPLVDLDALSRMRRQPDRLQKRTGWQLVWRFR